MKNVVKIYDKVPRSPLHNDTRRCYTGLVVLVWALLVALPFLNGVRLHDVGPWPFDAQPDRLFELLLRFARHWLVLVWTLSRVTRTKCLYVQLLLFVVVWKVVVEHFDTTHRAVVWHSQLLPNGDAQPNVVVL